MPTQSLEGIFDLSRIGVVGHSFGAAARRFCNEQANCLASINMDGSTFAIFDERIQAPYLQYASDIEASVAEEIRDDEDLTDEDIEELREELITEKQSDAHAAINAATTDVFLITLKSIAHSDYTVGWVDLHDYGLGKDVLHPLIESTSIDFFDTYMKSSFFENALCHNINSNKNIIMDFTNTCYSLY